MDTVKILGISGSLRQASLNTKLLHIAESLMPEGMTLEIFDLNPLPMYNGDLEKERFPDAVQAFRDRIEAADALLFACPEYNYSVTGALKNALDWGSRSSFPERKISVLNGKPAAVMGIGGRAGTTRAQMHFRQIATHINMYVLQRPEVLIPNGPVRGITDEGKLADPNSEKFLTDMLVALKDWTLKFRLPA